MKKKLIIGGIVLAAIIVLGVGGWFLTHQEKSYQVKISDNQNVLVSGSQIKVTQQDYFEVLLDQYGANEILNKAIDIIAEKELDDQEALDKAVDELTETYTQYSNGDLEATAKKYGYESKDEYIDDIIVPAAKQQLLREKYLKEHLDDYIKDSQVTSFKKIVVDKESTALSLIKDMKSEEDFDKKMKEYGDKAEDAGMVTKNSSALDSNLKNALEKLSTLEKDGIYSEAIKLSDDTYAIVYVYDADHKNTDEIIDKLSSDADIQEEIEAIYLKKYNFEVHDKKMKDMIKELSDQYFE